MTGDKLIVFCTVRDIEEGEYIAKTLVKERLAACVNIVPGLKSIYRFKGKIEEDKEALLMIKTSKELFKTVEEWILKLHSYEIPEVLAYEPYEMSGAFEAWWDEQLADPSSPDS
jgi:periplasmic divalent cation tolerance protein